MTDDMELLQDYANRNSEDAFAALVSRHVNMVYSVALRQVRNAHLAEEITQAVFIILARKAAALGPKTILSGWLCRTARYAAANALTIQRRRQNREQEAHMHSLLNEPETDAWQQVAPLLDAAMEQLGEKDHNALVLRFFEGKDFKQVGGALGTNEDAAKMRVSRALDKLRKLFAKRGVASTSTIIAGAILANSVQAAPMALAKTVTAVALAKGAAASGSTLTLIKGALKIMAWTKMKTAAVVGVAVILTAGTATTVAIKHSLSPKTIQIRAFIDGTDIIKIQGNKLWYEHEEFNFPGDPKSRNDPTTINGFAWRPQWNDKTSVAFDNLSPAFRPGQQPQIKLTKLHGRGEAAVMELPTPENNRTLSIYFHDDPPGADWYEVIVEWQP